MTRPGDYVILEGSPPPKRTVIAITADQPSNTNHFEVEVELAPVLLHRTGLSVSN